MRIENLLYLVGGELKNSPTVSNVANVQLTAKRVKRGDLFFALNKNEIDEAIKNGAYGIVFEGWMQITDPEIAWIKVPSLTKAALKLFRFFLINQRVPIHCITKIAYDLAKEYINESTLLFATGDLLQDLQNFVKKEPLALLVHDHDYLTKLALECEPLEQKELKRTSDYLFTSSFLYDGRYFERVPIAPLLLPHLQTTLDIAATYSLPVTLHQPSLKHFSPRFIDANFCLKEFGGSERVLIYESDYDFAKDAKDYLQSKAPWAKTLFFSDKELEGFIAIASIEELKEILYNRAFNYALYVGQSFDMELLKRQRAQKRLF